MSPPITTAQPTFEMSKTDCGANRNLNSLKTFDFSYSSGDAAGFNCLKVGPDTPFLSGRIKPRLTKMRRKQVGAFRNGKCSNIHLGCNGFNDFKLEGEPRNAFGSCNEISESLETKASADLNGNSEQSGGLGGGEARSGVELSDSKPEMGSESCHFLFGSSTNSSTLNLHLEDDKDSFALDRSSSNVDAGVKNGTFVFSASKTGPNVNQNSELGNMVFDSNESGLRNDLNLESAGFVFGVNESNCDLSLNFSEKESSGNLRQPKVDEFPKFYFFGSDKFESTSSVKLDQQDSNKSRWQPSVEGFGKANTANFVFCPCKTGSTENNLDPIKQDSGKNLNKNVFGKDLGKTSPVMKGKVKLDSSGDFEKAHPPCFKSSSNWSDGTGKDNVSYIFGSNNRDSKLGIDLENNPNCKKGCRSDDTDPGIENVGIGTEFQNSCPNGVFTFGALKDKGVFSTDGNTKVANETNQLNRGNAEDCNAFVEQNQKIGSRESSNFTSSCNLDGAVQKGSYELSDEMKRLNINGSGAYADKTKNLSSNLSGNVNNVFVFDNCQKISDPINMSERTPDTSYLSCNNIKFNQTSSSLFSSVGIESQTNGGFCEVPSMNKDENDGASFTSKLAGLDSSDTDLSKLNLKFSFSIYNLFSDVGNKFDGANSKLKRSKRLKQANIKLRKRTLAQKLSGQDIASKQDSSLKNHKSPGCGSPMDFSPYQNSCASKAPSPAPGIEVKGVECAGNEKDFGEHDDESNTNFSSPLAQDGLAAIRRQYRKKYKLKVGLCQTIQDENFDKNHAMQGIKSATTHETCENWRLRGNQAYQDGKFSKAEEFYSMGINSVPHASKLEYSMKPLLLCYSNRAATRMSLGRLREAIGDCTQAAALDPNFFKVTLRAGNCHLILGEVEDAINCYKKCLESGTGVCLDRRVTIESADGLQKAKRVSNCMSESSKLLQEGTNDAVNSALEKITEALSISRYSERLHEMKGGALCILRKYNEVIQLCEQTLDSAEKNFTVDHLDNCSCKSSRVRLWRWYLQAKSHYHLGRLDVALDLIEQEQKMHTTCKPGDVTRESSIALASSIRELLCLKRSGNDAFHSGTYTEAVEYYTVAISKSVDVRPFMAICFCNRAAAFQSIGQIVDAIADCSVAIALDENYQKAISRRAILHEMIRDYKQAVYDQQRLIFLIENQSQEKTQQYDSQNRSSGSSIRDLRKARRNFSRIEEKAKQEIPPDFYLILGIKASDTESQIKKAYRKAALRHHPDKASQVLVRSDTGDDGTLWKEVGEKIHNDADRLFKIIGEAYAVLSDSYKRSKYDKEEETRKVFNHSNRSSNPGRSSTSYKSPYETGSWSGRQDDYGTPASSQRNNARRHWHHQWHKDNI